MEEVKDKNEGMTTINYAIQFHSCWHCGSGLAAGASADAVVIKDQHGLPYVPGKTIKGLLREVMEEFGLSEQDEIDKMFGTRTEGADRNGERVVGQCYFSNATLSEEEQQVIVTNKWQHHLLRTIASTAIDEKTGTAKDTSLRTIEVAVPCTLCGEIHDVPAEAAENMKNALRLIKRLGTNRNRGLGRCDITGITFTEQAKPKGQPETGTPDAAVKMPNNTTLLQFRCTLLTDIILNVKSASEGNNQTLDFIPGNNFLGIAAARLYNDDAPKQELLDLFHNGTVRFGDAHPAIGRVRTLRVPAALYYPKPQKEGEKPNYFISYLHDFAKDAATMQPKQCRTGFYAFDFKEKKDIEEGKAVAAKARTPKAFAQKSAYDRQKRRAKDEQMFGYESLEEGTEFLFSVETDNDGYVKKIKDALTGTRRLGRSRGAQYGLVKIEPCAFSEAQSGTEAGAGGNVTVYADGRLIFLDDCGLPTFRPTVKQLGVEHGVIDWEKSQVRTFQYAPWNGKRHTYDTDRLGIEKGSVFVVKGAEEGQKPAVSNPQARFVGSYRNEGFGRVIYNAPFLKPKADTNGEVPYRLGEEPEAESPDVQALTTDTPLLKYLSQKACEVKTMSEIYGKVNQFVAKNEQCFKQDKFASQWGKIRSIAQAAKSKAEMQKELLTKTKMELNRKTGKNESKPDAYLTHGKAADKWKEHKRKENFEKFFNELFDTYDDYFMKQAIVNLASQMAKKCNPSNPSGKEEKQ